MSEEIIKVLDDLAERFGIAVDWTSKNVMPYLQELFDKFINWEIWTSVMFGSIGVIILAIGIVFFILMRKAEKSSDDSDDAFAYCLLGIGSLIVGGAMMFSQLYDIIECITFPEKVLFDYATCYMESH